MALAPTLRLAINREQDLRALPLTPQDFFVFSRVETLGGGEGPRLADIAAAAGLSVDATSEVVERLIELGALLVREGEPAPRAWRRGTTANTLEGRELRERARDRRRVMLEAQLRGLKKQGLAGERPDPARAVVDEGDEVAGGAAGPDEVALPEAKVEQPAEGRPVLEAVRPVALNDPRLDAASAVPVERQRRLLSVHDSLGQIGHFDLLGLAPVDDPKVVRRAFHVTSRQFHPDAFYGKELGVFRKILDDLFRRSRASYEYLMVAEQRRSLVDVYLARIAREHDRAQAVAEVEAEEARAASAEAAAAAAAEAERKAAEAARAREAEHEILRARIAQRGRDRIRADKKNKEAVFARRDQAVAQAKRAHDELERGRHGAAATLFRLAHEQDPINPEYERLWRECLAVARGERAKVQRKRAEELGRDGRGHEAAKAYAQAAEANPSLGNLSDAVTALLGVDDDRARKFARRAVDALAEAGERPSLSRSELVRLHVSCARAFLAGGDTGLAKEQAERAHELAPSSDTRTLLKSIKLA